MNVSTIPNTNTQVSSNVPSRIFIVPYKNRPQHKFFFSQHMNYLLEDFTNYEIYFSHQEYERVFNRGAVKNIGFLAMKKKYPNDYKNITFIFNDVDTVPFDKIFNYNTVTGVVAHYYGFKHALGGIVVIKGEDFEKINGYPCFWGWGQEDNCLHKRCVHHNIKFDYSNFYPIGSPQILQLFDGVSRVICKHVNYKGMTDNGVDGLKTISKLEYTIDINSSSDDDNIFKFKGDSGIQFINIKKFSVYEPYVLNSFEKYDLRDPETKPTHPLSNINRAFTNNRDKKKHVSIKDHQQLIKSADTWTNIPHNAKFEATHAKAILRKNRIQMKRQISNQQQSDNDSSENNSYMSSINNPGTESKHEPLFTSHPIINTQGSTHSNPNHHTRNHTHNQVKHSHLYNIIPTRNHGGSRLKR
jgi:hypothetical protein